MQEFSNEADRSGNVLREKVNHPVGEDHACYEVVDDQKQLVGEFSRFFGGGIPAAFFGGWIMEGDEDSES
jgi:hypothetical protein